MGSSRLVAFSLCAEVRDASPHPAVENDSVRSPVHFRSVNRSQLPLTRIGPETLWPLSTARALSMRIAHLSRSIPHPSGLSSRTREAWPVPTSIR